MSWRDHARRVIDGVYRDCLARGTSGDEFRQALSEAYPFGERRMHPYKVWLDECGRWRQQFAQTSDPEIAYHRVQRATRRPMSESDIRSLFDTEESQP